VFTARYGLGPYIILRSAHTLYLCVLCGSENKQPLFPYTTLTEMISTTSIKNNFTCIQRFGGWD